MSGQQIVRSSVKPVHYNLPVHLKKHHDEDNHPLYHYISVAHQWQKL